MSIEFDRRFQGHRILFLNISLREKLMSFNCLKLGEILSEKCNLDKKKIDQSRRNGDIGENEVEMLE